MRTFYFVGLALMGFRCSSVECGGTALERLWRTPISGVSYTNPGGADAQHSYVIFGGALKAHRMSDGALAWSSPVVNVCSPVLSRDGRVFCPSDRVQAFNSSTGVVLWEHTPESTAQLTDGTVDDDRLYVGTREGGVAYALDVATGRVVWRKQLLEPGWAGAWVRGLAVAGDTMFASLSRHYSENGYYFAAVVVALDAATGRELWRFQDGDGTDSRSVSGAVAVSGRTVLYPNNNAGEFTAFDRETRAVRWRVKQDAGFVGPYQAPTVVDGVGYAAGGDKNVYAIDVATGVVKWKGSPEPFTYWSHAVCGSVVLANNRALSVVDRATGRKRGVLFGSEDEGVKSVDAVGNRAYVATNRAVYAFACPP